MTRTLIPCPFCGSQQAKLSYPQRCVKCVECGMSGPIGETAEQGARLWNQRATLANYKPVPPPSILGAL